MPATEKQVAASPYGRYLVPLTTRLLQTLSTVAFFVASIWLITEGNGVDLSAALLAVLSLIYAVCAVLVAVAWFVPVTVVTADGIRRPFAHPRQLAWADIAGFEASRVWRFDRVDVRLRSGTRIRLGGVPRSVVSALQQVAAEQPTR